MICNEGICIQVEPPCSKSLLLLASYRPPIDTIETFHKHDKVFNITDGEDKEVLLADADANVIPPVFSVNRKWIIVQT